MWSSCAAAGVRRMLNSWPARKVRSNLIRMAADEAAWAQLATELRVFLPDDEHHHHTALEALHYLRTRLHTLSDAADQRRACKSFTTTLNKRGKAAERVAVAPRREAVPRHRAT